VRRNTQSRSHKATAVQFEIAAAILPSVPAQNFHAKS